MNRRGFLSLVGTGAAALVMERALPAAFKPAARPRLRQLADSPQVERYVMSFSPELGFQEIVEPGGIVRLVARPQVLFRPDRLIFAPGTELAKFSLLQVTSGGDVQLDGAIEAQQFAPEMYAPPVGLRDDDEWSPPRQVFDVTRPGDEIILALRNHSSQDAEFRAAAMMGLRAR